MHGSIAATTDCHGSSQVGTAVYRGDHSQDVTMPHQTFETHEPDHAEAWNLWTDHNLGSDSEIFVTPFQPEDHTFDTMAEFLSFDLTGFSLNPFMGPFPDIEHDALRSASISSE